MITCSKAINPSNFLEPPPFAKTVTRCSGVKPASCKRDKEVGGIPSILTKNSWPVTPGKTCSKACNAAKFLEPPLFAKTLTRCSGVKPACCKRNKEVQRFASIPTKNYWIVTSGRTCSKACNASKFLEPPSFAKILTSCSGVKPAFCKRDKEV